MKDVYWHTILAPISWQFWFDGKKRQNSLRLWTPASCSRSGLQRDSKLESSPVCGPQRPCTPHLHPDSCRICSSIEVSSPLKWQMSFWSTRIAFQRCRSILSPIRSSRRASPIASPTPTSLFPGLLQSRVTATPYRLILSQNLVHQVAAPFLPYVSGSSLFFQLLCIPLEAIHLSFAPTPC